MNRVFIGLILTLWAIPSFACTGSSPNWIASNWADVAACHTSASNGDTITVTPGSYTATTEIDLTKFVHLVGTNVTVTDNVCSGSCTTGSLLGITESTAGSTTIRNFTILQGTSNHQAPVGVFTLNPASSGDPIVVQNNSFGINTGSGGWTNSQILSILTYHGVIADNSMYGEPNGSLCQSLTGFIHSKMNSPPIDWPIVPTYGSNDTTGTNALYIETNHIYYTTMIDADDLTRAVVRYNVLFNADVAAHGADTSTNGQRYTEAYNNTFLYDKSLLSACSEGPVNLSDFIIWRGGTGRIWNNVIPTINASPFYSPQNAVHFTDYKLRRDQGPYACWNVLTDPGAGYPDPHLVGWGYLTGATNPGGNTTPQDLEPVYLWGNTGAGNYGQPNSNPSIDDYSPPDAACGMTPDSASTYIVQNREFYTQNASIDTTQGVSVGVNSSRPSTCTKGVAYFNSDLNRLDICTATNTWGSPYTAYTYPHPLTNLTSGQTYYISDTIASGQVTGTLTGYTSVVTGTASHSTSPNGFDVRPYSNSSCTSPITNYQLDYWNSSTKAFILWVNVTAQTGTQIFICEGDPTLNTDGSSTGAWDSNTKGVWHLGNNGSIVLGTDTTSQANNFTVTGTIGIGTGQIDGAASFNGTTGNYLLGANSSAYNATSNSLTVSAWFYTTATGAFQMIMTRDYSSTGREFQFRENTSNNLEFIIFDNSVTPHTFDGVATITTNTWHYVVATYDGSDVRLYVDGALDNGAQALSITVNVPATANLEVGGVDTTGSFVATGNIDEPHISTGIARSANWIAAEYNNQFSPTTFWTAGSETPVTTVSATSSRARFRKP